jgi:hypothetical protein
LSKYFGYALILGVVIISPNIFWQFGHNWPVFMHMKELRETQLVHVRISDFVKDQLIMNAQAALIWIVALMVLLVYRLESKYRIFAYMYILVIAILLLASGKSYYSLGIYPILFVFGAHLIEKYSGRFLGMLTGIIILSMVSATIIAIPLDGIPLGSYEMVYKKDAYRWEDGKYYDIPQDMSDMTGWKELGNEVEKAYLSLGEENSDNCEIFCYHYGQAGAVMFYGKDSHVPTPISFNASFAFWAPDSLTKDFVIWTHSPSNDPAEPDIDSLLNVYFMDHELVHTINNDRFRENGTKIFLCEKPKPVVKKIYRSTISEIKKQYKRD